MRYGAVTLDAAGTLLHLHEPVGQTYARLARRYGVTRAPEVIEQEFQRALRAPWVGRRYDGDGRPFWREVVRRSTGSADPGLFEDAYRAFGPGAWRVAEGAGECIDALRASGVRVGLVSNWDNRLRGLLSVLELQWRFDTLLISGEVQMEKPDARIFDAACRRLGVPHAHLLHIGDSRRADLVGARGAGCEAWLYGRDVHSFKEIEERVLQSNG